MEHGRGQSSRGAKFPAIISNAAVVQPRLAARPSQTAGGQMKETEGGRVSTGGFDRKRLVTELSAAEKEMPPDLVQHRNLERGLKTREVLLPKYVELILGDVDYAVEKDVDVKLWRTLFHCFIEEFRRQLHQEAEERSAVVTEQHFFGFLDQAAEFYRGLLDKTRDAFRIDDNIIIQLKSKDKTLNLKHLAAIFKVWHTAIIYLGDIGENAHFHLQCFPPLPFHSFLSFCSH